MSQTFETTLYEAVGLAFPGLTVRSMGRLLGKSSGYWSSMTSQRLPLPTDTLIHLADVVECQKILLPWGSERLTKLEKVQALLCEEIRTRFVLIRSYLVKTDLDSTGEWIQQRKLHFISYEPLPFLVGRY